MLHIGYLCYRVLNRTRDRTAFCHNLSQQHAKAELKEAQDGVIKFRIEQHPENEYTKEDKDSAKRVGIVRDFLHKLNLIGVYSNGLGFGNVSELMSRNSTTNKKPFCVTGTQTGAFEHLSVVEHFSVVTDYDFASHKIVCKGPMKPSSESITHAMCYESDHSIGAVIHIHSYKWWSKLLEKCPTEVPRTAKNVPYGSPEMAEAVKQLLINGIGKDYFASEGHIDGVFFYGKDLIRTLNLLLSVGEEMVEAFDASVWEEFKRITEELV